jgi:hypothetical protein
MSGIETMLLTALTSAGGGAAAGIGNVLSIGGTLMSVAGQARQADEAKELASFNAQQEERRAQQERVSGEQGAAEERRQGRLMQSRALAVGGASGGGIDIDNLSSIETESERRASFALWGGEERARGAEDSAAVARFEGSQKAAAARTRATGTLISGGVSWLDKYAPRDKTPAIA